MESGGHAPDFRCPVQRHCFAEVLKCFSSCRLSLLVISSISEVRSVVSTKKGS
ncbi:hypothetical protein SAY86_016614 [Trapa natans]|uniref:Uncharacterized protein n=1 Tax=Trapa natans TaxID=22666 RepID=A0AAN7LM15_TRANT|nr:hypothetical protein SAY86_016614 [Trapa natans]